MISSGMKILPSSLSLDEVIIVFSISFGKVSDCFFLVPVESGQELQNTAL